MAAIASFSPLFWWAYFWTGRPSLGCRLYAYVQKRKLPDELVLISTPQHFYLRISLFYYLYVAVGFSMFYCIMVCLNRLGVGPEYWRSFETAAREILFHMVLIAAVMLSYMSGALVRALALLATATVSMSALAEWAFTPWGELMPKAYCSWEMVAGAAVMAVLLFVHVWRQPDPLLVAKAGGLQ